MIYFTEDNTLKELARKVFDYKGKKIKIVTQDYYTLSNYWDGGTINYCALVCRDDLKVYTPSQDTKNPFKAIAHETFNIPKNHFIIQHSIFRGKDHGITVYVREDEIDNIFISSDKEDLSIEEKIVLYCFRCYKSSYANIKDYRKYNALEIIKEEEYEEAKNKLVSKNLINKRNSLTTEGKNIAISLPSDYELKNEYSLKKEK